MEAEEKKKKLATWLKWAGGLIGAVVISPFVFLAVKGIVGLGLALLTGTVILKLSPIVSMKMSNLVLKGIANEAAANPIETMQNLLVEKAQELKDADQAIVDFETEVRNYDDQTVEFSKQYPDEAASFKEIGRKMHEGLVQQQQIQKEARGQLIDLDRKIEKAKAIYKMAMAANKVTSLSKSAETEIFQNIRETVALDSVRTQLNRSFASLNMAITQGKTAIPVPVQRVAIEEGELASEAVTVDIPNRKRRS